VPYKSTCCCKCVSTRWRDLFSHPDHRKKLPQPLAGFFYESYNRDRFPKTARYFTNVSGKGHPLVDPSLSFLPRYDSLHILDCCNGLLLCRCWKPTDPKTLDYVVCNPATENWVVVTATDWSSKVVVARIGFEPAVSSHFHVFEFIDQEVWGIDQSELSAYRGRIAAVATYSSKAGVWTHQMVEDEEFVIPAHSKGVFFNGIMHLAAFDYMVVTFDVKGNLLRVIGTPSPSYRYEFPVNDVFLSQGQLYFSYGTASESDNVSEPSSESYSSDLLVWVLEDYSSEKWTLKHTVSHLQLFGDKFSGYPDYNVVSFHPERNMIFIVCGDENSLMSYEMDFRKPRFLRRLGCECQLEYRKVDVKTPFIPYVPLFMESLADGP
jgi:F-box interacting protein